MNFFIFFLLILTFFCSDEFLVLSCFYGIGFILNYKYNIVENIFNSFGLLFWL